MTLYKMSRYFNLTP